MAFFVSCHSVTHFTLKAIPSKEDASFSWKKKKFHIAKIFMVYPSCTLKTKTVFLTTLWFSTRKESAAIPAGKPPCSCKPASLCEKKRGQHLLCLRVSIKGGCLLDQETVQLGCEWLQGWKGGGKNSSPFGGDRAVLGLRELHSAAWQSKGRPQLRLKLMQNEQRKCLFFKSWISTGIQDCPFDFQR